MKIGDKVRLLVDYQCVAYPYKDAPKAGDVCEVVEVCGYDARGVVVLFNGEEWHLFTNQGDRWELVGGPTEPPVFTRNSLSGGVARLTSEMAFLDATFNHRDVATLRGPIARLFSKLVESGTLSPADAAEVLGPGWEVEDG